MSDPYLSAWSSQFAAMFFGVFFAFSKWSLVLYVTFVYSKDMSKPLYSVALWSSRRVLHLRLFRPEDAAYFSETPIVKSNDPIHISFYYMPAFWVMKETRLDMAVINSDLCFHVILVWLPDGLESCKYSECLPKPCTDALVCWIVFADKPAKEGDVLDVVKWIIAMGEHGLAFMHITGLGVLLIFSPLIFKLVDNWQLFSLSVVNCRRCIFQGRKARLSASAGLEVGKREFTECLWINQADHQSNLSIPL